MTLDELDTEARMRGTHVWQSRGAPSKTPGFFSPRFYAVVPSDLDQSFLQTFVADSVEEMAAKLAAYWGRGKHAADRSESQAREDSAMPYIGKRRSDG